MDKNQNYYAMIAYEIFEINKHGKELLNFMRNFYRTLPILPAQNLEQFGGAVGYAGFRSGQMDVINFIDMLLQINQQNDQIPANQTEEI